MDTFQKDVDNGVIYINHKLSKLIDKDVSPEQYNLIAKAILEKCLERCSNAEAIHDVSGKFKHLSDNLYVEHLHDNFYIEYKEDLLIEVVKCAFFCTSYYNRETKETFPLTEEKIKYIETLPVDMM